MVVVEKICFEATRRLIHLPQDHPCASLHGHHFCVELHVQGPLHPQLGWVADFTALRQAFAPCLEELQGRLLNTVEGLANPTSELMAVWIWQRLKPRLEGLTALVVHETETSRCIYSGPEHPAELAAPYLDQGPKAAL